MQDVKRRLEAAVPELSAEHEARLVADATSVGEPHRE
jgi:hypothetical protein